MILVGLTGGIGSGKTTVAKMFSELGVPIYNSDEEAKRLMETSPEIIKDITRLLGKNSYKGKKLNRIHISNRIFNNHDLLKKLNGIVHPAVRKHFLLWAARQDAPYVIQETALLFEIGSQDFYDKIILVTAPTGDRIKRVMERDEASTERSIRDRMKNQWEDGLKKNAAHFVIENIDLMETKSKVVKVHNTLLGNS